jgi:hypothetical protein
MRNLLLCLSACLLAAGCNSVKVAAVDRADYSMLEGLQAKVYHVARVTGPNQSALAGSRGDTILLEYVPDPSNEPLLKRIHKDAPPWLRIERLADAAEQLGQALPQDRTLWVLSNNPLVVAVGQQRVPPPSGNAAEQPILPADGTAKLPRNLRLITAGDLTQPTTRLFVIAKWQNKAMASVQGRYVTLDPVPIPALPAEIPLDQPTTLKTLLVEHPWSKPGVIH